MTTTIHNQSPTAAAAMAQGATPLLAISPEVREAAEGFLKAWVTAWNARDAHALATLHTEDCVTINRYGTLIPNRQDAEEALSFLLGPNGPFGETLFEPMQLVALRAVAPGVAIVQASWRAPALAPNGQIVPDQFNQMMMSYTLVKHEGQWMTTQIDGHNVEHMELPFFQPEQTQ